MSELDLVILKNITTNKKSALDFINDCDPKVFEPEMWNFANLVVSYLRTYKEVPTLKVMMERLSKGNTKLAEHFEKTWKQLDKVNCNEAEYKYQLEKIKNRYAEKQISSAQEALNKQSPGMMDIPKAVSEMQKAIQSIKGINEAKSYDRKTLKKALPAFKEKFNAKKNNPKVDAGLMTGYSFFDFATNGARPADFILIAGESGFGKSLLLNNIAVQVWMQQNTLETATSDFTEGKNVVYFSLEMPYDDCFNRLLSRLSGVPSRKIETPSTLDKEEIQKIKVAIDFIERYPYEFEIIDIADACANDLDLILDDVQYPIDAAFVDYLGIMRTNEKNSEEQDWLKQGIISYELRAICRKRSLPLFSAVQLNRKSPGKDSSENIGLNRLARSATIATNATHVLQIENRGSSSGSGGEDNFPDMIVHFIKNRKGPKGKFRLIKNLACATLLDEKIENKEEEDTTIFYNRDIDDISAKAELLDL